MDEKPDPRTERERRQAEALKANLRRRKTQARGLAEAARSQPSKEGRPGEE